MSVRFTDGNEGIGKHDEELLAEAKRSGQRSVSVLVATEPGAAARGAEALAQAGATVQHRADELGYARAEVPVDDDEIVLPGLPWHPGKADPGSQPQPDADTPRVNPYLPTGDTGAAQFVEGHPSSFPVPTTPTVTAQTTGTRRSPAGDRLGMTGAAGQLAGTAPGLPRRMPGQARTVGTLARCT